MVCVVSGMRGPLYSLWRSVPAIFIHGNMPNRHQKDKISLPAKMNLDRCLSGFGRTPDLADPWFGRPHLAASGHCLSLVHCLVGPDVGTSVLGLRWSVWSGLWASFACVTLDAIFCNFVCVLFVLSSYSSKTTVELG